MKVESTTHTRYLRFSELPNGEFLDVEIRYKGHSNVHSAIVLDNVIIPHILHCVNGVDTYHD